MRGELWMVLMVLIPVCGFPMWPGQAQITPDASLRNPSRVRRERTTRVITGGTQVGNNLFHSFQEFSIPQNGTASFRNISPQVENVFSRVTGRSVSRINGSLEALQANGSLSSANFFLLNPNGILLGRNASLNLGGSFMATTAEAVRFADGSTFSTLNPQRSLLTVSVPVGLQFGENPGPIRNQSQSNLVLNASNIPISGGLELATGRTLALVGGHLDIAGGVMFVPAGRLELGSVTGPGSVGLTTTSSGWKLDYSSIRQRGDMRFSRSAFADVSGTTGGGIQLQADQITLTDETLIFADTQGNQQGQDVVIWADELNLENFSLISAGTRGTGNGGHIRVNSNRLTARTGGQISTRTTGSGNAGSLTVTATEQIFLDGSGSILGIPTGLFSQTGVGSAGRGGRLSLSTPLLQLQEGAQIASDTSGSGSAGTIRIRAETVDFSGVLRNPSGEVVLDRGLPLPSGIFADSNATSNAPGGAIIIDTQRLRLRDGAVLQTNAEGTGDAGNLTIRATAAVELSGTAAERTPTTIFAASGGVPGDQGGGTSTATGRSGTVNIRTSDLSVQNGAVIAVSSLNPDQQAAGAGNLNIRAEQISLANRGRLIAETASGDGGNINLRVQDSLVLRNTSQISTSAGIEGRGGNGGNIEVNTEFVLTAPAEDSDIRANAFTGRGGNVTITAEGILGIEPRQRPTNFSDITASSEFGTPGEVIIRSPDVEPSTRAPELAATPLNDRPAQGCEIAQSTSTAEFFTTGRGGISISPYEPLSSDEILADIRLPSQNRDWLSTAAGAIVEAQSWSVDDKGTVILVAAAPIPIHRCKLQ